MCTAEGLYKDVMQDTTDVVMFYNDDPMEWLNSFSECVVMVAYLDERVP
jgi:hypothetical protein